MLKALEIIQVLTAMMSLSLVVWIVYQAGRLRAEARALRRELDRYAYRIKRLEEKAGIEWINF